MKQGCCPPSNTSPPRPPQIHQGVFRCPASDIRRFCQNTDFLRTLLQAQGIPTDELVAAVLRQTAAVYEASPMSSPGQRQWLLGAGRNLALHLRDDYTRLKSILGKLQIA